MDEADKSALLALLAPRSEAVALGERVLTVRELSSAADTMAFADNADLSFKLLVRCVVDAAGEPVFADADIPALKESSRLRLLPLIEAVRRVNGFDAEDNEKK